MSPAEFNRAMGGHQPEFSVPKSSSPDKSRKTRGNRSRLKLLRAILKLDKHLPGEIKQRIAIVAKQRDVDMRQLSMEQLRQRLSDQVALAYQFSLRSMLANTSAGLWHDLLETLISKVAPNEKESLTSHLMAGSGNVVSAEHGYRLINLAEAAKSDPTARALRETEPLDKSGWQRLPETSPFRREMEQFLSDFGHRAVYEVDIANPRWIEDPTFILQQVRFILDGHLPKDFRESGRQRRLEAERTIARRTLVMRPIIRWLAARARHGFALREGAKSALVAHLEPCRRIITELGRRMYEAEVLENPDDIFYLSWIEIDAFMCSEWDGRGAKALVTDRKIQRETWLAEEVSDVIFEDDDNAKHQSPAQSLRGDSSQTDLTGPLDLTRIDPISKDSIRTLKGTGVAAGMASGKVRILRHPDEGDKLAAGEILVAPSTDPGWTPLFMRAAAVVMEVGGYHSHGATVAREFGIPAVANIPDLLTTLRDGEVIIVHGDTGMIEFEDKSR